MDQNRMDNSIAAATIFNHVLQQHRNEDRCHSLRVQQVRQLRGRYICACRVCKPTMMGKKAIGDITASAVAHQSCRARQRSDRPSAASRGQTQGTRCPRGHSPAAARTATAHQIYSLTHNTHGSNMRTRPMCGRASESLLHARRASSWFTCCSMGTGSGVYRVPPALR